MTDKEKLSAVRAEIEMRKESLKPHGGQGLVVTRLMRELCDDFLSFIDSIPEEPKDKCLFDDEPEIVDLGDIPFGARNSELEEAIYHIPEGYHAIIDGDKVIIKKL